MAIRTVEVSTIINHPLEQTFSFVSNSLNNEKWMNDVREISKTSDGPIGLGTKFQYMRKVIGKLIAGNIVVHQYEPNKHYGYRSVSGNARGEVDYYFSPVPHGTEFNIKLTIDMTKFSKHSRPVWPIALFFVKKRYQKDLKKLKRVIEA